MKYNGNMKEKRTKLEKREGIQATLERYRRFDYDYIPFGDGWRMPDEKYPYKHGFFGTVFSGILRFLMATLGTLLLKIAYGMKVEGKKNLKAVKRTKTGVISVSNHISFLDTLMVRSGVGYYRSFHTMGPRNNKKGLGGAFMHHAAMWAFSTDLKATRKLVAEMERRLKEGAIVNFYAEQAMWVNYQKPRPMKDGAFHYAVRFGVPVLPVFFTFRKNKRGHMRALRIHVLPAVYADETLPRKERVEKMRRQAEQAWQDCYEKAYGKPLSYLPSARKRDSGFSELSE